MVNRVIILSIFLYSIYGTSQTLESLHARDFELKNYGFGVGKFEGTMGPSVKDIEAIKYSIENGSVLVMINNVILPSGHATFMLHNRKEYFTKAKYFLPDRAFKKWRIKTSKGLIVLKTKKQIIDLREKFR